LLAWFCARPGRFDRRLEIQPLGIQRHQSIHVYLDVLLLGARGHQVFVLTYEFDIKH